MIQSTTSTSTLERGALGSNGRARVGVGSAKNAAIEVGIYSWHRYILAWQWLFQFTGRIIGRYFLRHSMIEYTEEHIEPGVKYVIAVNHQTYFDPWVVPGSIPYSCWLKMGMPRAFVANRFFGYPLVGNLLRSVGAFPAKQHPTDPYGLAYATTLMERGQSIIIFPEGGLSRNREKRAHNGVMVLAHIPNVKVIPIHLEWYGEGWKRCLDMGIGKPFDGSKMTAQEILDHIYALPVR